jgi:hypothetical protein
MPTVLALKIELAISYMGEVYDIDIFAEEYRGVSAYSGGVTGVVGITGDFAKITKFFRGITGDLAKIKKISEGTTVTFWTFSAFPKKNPNFKNNRRNFFKFPNILGIFRVFIIIIYTFFAPAVELIGKALFVAQTIFHHWDSKPGTGPCRLFFGLRS